MMDYGKGSFHLETLNAEESSHAPFAIPNLSGVLLSLAKATRAWGEAPCWGMPTGASLTSKGFYMPDGLQYGGICGACSVQQRGLHWQFARSLRSQFAYTFTYRF